MIDESGNPIFSDSKDDSPPLWLGIVILAVILFAGAGVFELGVKIAQAVV